MSRVSLIEVVDVARFLDHVAGCVVQVCVELGLLHDSQRLLLQKLDLFRDDAQFAPGDGPSALVRFLNLIGKSKMESLNGMK